MHIEEVYDVYARIVHLLIPDNIVPSSGDNVFNALVIHFDANIPPSSYFSSPCSPFLRCRTRLRPFRGQVYKDSCSPVLISEDFTPFRSIRAPFFRVTNFQKPYWPPLSTHSPLNPCTTIEVNSSMDKGGANPGENPQRHAYDLHGVGYSWVSKKKMR